MPKWSSAVRLASAILLTSCATAWELAPADSEVPSPAPPRACHVVASVTLVMDARELPAIAYVALDGANGLRAHLDTESGLTILDVEIRGGEVQIHSQSALAGLPGLTERVVADLRRALGDRSLFARDRSGLRAAARVVSGPSGDPSAWRAVPVEGGGWASAHRGAFGPEAGTPSVTLLDADRVPRAEVSYADPGPGGLPQSIRVRDLRDGHAMHLEAESVTATAAPAGP